MKNPNLNELAMDMAALEGKKVELSIAQIKEVLRIFFTTLSLKEVIKIWFKYNKE